METSNRELIFIYNQTQRKDKTFLARAKDLPRVKLNEINVDKEPLAGTLLAEIAQGLGVEIQELLETDHEEMPEKAPTKQEDVIALIRKSPVLLRTPIAIKGNIFRFIKEFKDIHDLGNFHHPHDTKNVKLTPRDS